MDKIDEPEDKVQGAAWVKEMGAASDRIWRDLGRVCDAYQGVMKMDQAFTYTAAYRAAVIEQVARLERDVGKAFLWIKDVNATDLGGAEQGGVPPR